MNGPKGPRMALRRKRCASPRKWLAVLLVLMGAAAQAQDNNAHVFKGKPHPIKVVVQYVADKKLLVTYAPTFGMGPDAPILNVPEVLYVYTGTLYVADTGIPTNFTCECQLDPDVSYWARLSKPSKSGKFKVRGKLKVILQKGKHRWEETVVYSRARP